LLDFEWSHPISSEESQMDSELVKYAKAVLGLVIFIGAIVALELTGVVQLFAKQPAVEAGKVAVGGTEAFVTIVQTVLGFLFTYAVIFFKQIGEFAIGLWVGFTSKKEKSVAAPVASATKAVSGPAELDELVSDLTKEARATLKAKVELATAEAKSEIESRIREAMEAIKDA
jgi:hypothetical protein